MSPNWMLDYNYAIKYCWYQMCYQKSCVMSVMETWIEVKVELGLNPLPDGAEI